MPKVTFCSVMFILNKKIIIIKNPPNPQNQKPATVFPEVKSKEIYGKVSCAECFFTLSG